jgi:hypothetical protein
LKNYKNILGHNSLRQYEKWHEFLSENRKIGIIEITGPSGSGKSTYIRNKLSKEHVLIGGMPTTYGSATRLVTSIFLIIYALHTRSLQFDCAKLLLKQTIRYDENWIRRINAYRNCIAKFGYPYFTKNGTITFIDEGISHIPFILEMSHKDIVCFVNKFQKYLDRSLILFKQNPPREILLKRILSRGHKRVNSYQDAEAFVTRNITIAKDYKKVLQNKTLNVIYI